jgi:hypothetical protein
MTVQAATPNTQSAKPDTSAAPVAPTGARKRQSAAVRFPARFHMAISIPMAESLRRLTGGPHSLLAEADIGRLALNAYLVANDPYYARLMRGGGNGNA